MQEKPWRLVSKEQRGKYKGRFYVYVTNQERDRKKVRCAAIFIVEVDASQNKKEQGKALGFFLLFLLWEQAQHAFLHVEKFEIFCKNNWTITQI